MEFEGKDFSFWFPFNIHIPYQNHSNVDELCLSQSTYVEHTGKNTMLKALSVVQSHFISPFITFYKCLPPQPCSLHNS